MINSHLCHHGDGDDDGLSSAGSSSVSYESFAPDDMTEEESYLIWLHRNREIGERVLRERRQKQQEQRQRPLVSGEAVADHDHTSAAGSLGGERSRGSRNGEYRGGSARPPTARASEDLGGNPYPFDDPALRDAYLHEQHFMARVREQQELEQEAMRRQLEAVQRLAEATQRREALERLVYAQALAGPQDVTPLAPEAWEYERLSQAHYARTMEVQINDAMQQEEEDQQRRMRAAAQHHQVRPDAGSNDFTMGGAGAIPASPQDAAPLAAQDWGYERLPQPHYAMAAQVNDADSHHRPPADITTVDSGNDSSNSMNDSASSTADYSSDGDKTMKGDSIPNTRPNTTSNNVDTSSSHFNNDGASSITATDSSGNKGKKPKPKCIAYYLASSSPTRSNTKLVTCRNCKAGLYTQPPALGFVCELCGLTTCIVEEEKDEEAERGEGGRGYGDNIIDDNLDDLVDAWEEKMMDLWDYGVNDEGMDM